MRKEFSQARLLSIAQAQAIDEAIALHASKTSSLQPLAARVDRQLPEIRLQHVSFSAYHRS